LKNAWVFSAAMAGALMIVAGVAYLLLNLAYLRWLQVPIESVAVVVFFVYKVAPCVFILSVPYAMLMRWVLGRRGMAAGLSQFSVAFGIGAFATILILAIIFPCDAQPGFVGGYLLGNLFR
jgi:hypothetical protein